MKQLFLYLLAMMTRSNWIDRQTEKNIHNVL